MSAYRHAVIISSYNRPKMVREAIQSCLYQRSSVQVVVADDDSDDETRAAIELEIRGRSNCLVIYANRPREGALKNVTLRATSCINDALAKVDAEFVHYLPDDDVFASGRFCAFETFFDANQEVSVAYGRMILVSDRRERLDELYIGAVLTDAVNWVDHGQFCHRFGVLKDVPGWPAEPHYAFDANFFLALARAGYTFHPVDHVVNYKLIHGRNLMSERDRDDVPATRET